MENRVEVKRKHARFPAYDDEIGVKILRDRRRHVFDDVEPLITSTHVSDYSADNQRSLRRHSKPANEKTGHTIEQQMELEKHRANLPDYGKAYHRIAKASPTGKKSLFGDAGNRSSYIVRKREVVEAQQITDPAIPAQRRRSRFVPSFVPASVIPDKDENMISKAELMAAIKKDSDSYLLFDDEPSAYEEEMTEVSPAVQKFEGSQKPAVKMTRSEYKKIGRKKGLFEPKTATGKNKTILERSLSGLIEEDSSDLSNNGYFPE